MLDCQYHIIHCTDKFRLQIRTIYYQTFDWDVKAKSNGFKFEWWYSRFKKIRTISCLSSSTLSTYYLVLFIFVSKAFGYESFYTKDSVRLDYFVVGRPEINRYNILGFLCHTFWDSRQIHKLKNWRQSFCIKKKSAQTIY